MTLESLLLQSEKLHAELGDIWRGMVLPQSQRGQVVTAYCSIVREHVLSQQALLTHNFDVTAMTLVRPSFESLVRSIWCLEGASDTWVSTFMTAPAANTDKRDETITGPPVDSMLETIQKHHPAFIHQALTELKEATWKPMHSYVHGGIRPVVQALVGCPENLRVALVLNGNGFVMVATNVLSIACGAGVLGLPSIQQRFASCLPPLSGATLANVPLNGS